MKRAPIFRSPVTAEVRVDLRKSYAPFEKVEQRAVAAQDRNAEKPGRGLAVVRVVNGHED